MAKTMLVVDANREFGILVRQSLEDSGSYKVELVHTEQQALDAAANNRFDMALIDFSLPDIAGPELAKRLAEMQPNLSIVAVPKAGSDEDLSGLPVAGILSKPFYLPDLPRILEKVLQKHSLRSDWRQWQDSEMAPNRATDTAPQDDAIQPGEPATTVAPSAPSHVPEELLAQGVAKVQAEAAMLWDGERAVVSSGLSSNQERDLAATLKGMGKQIEQRRAVTKYTSLPGLAADLQLFASHWRGHLTLISLFPADKPFGQVRRSSQELAQHISSGRVVAQPATTPTEPQPSAEQPEVLPQDWIPQREFSPAQRAQLDELAAINPPPADPEVVEASAPSGSVPPLPQDWIPSSQRSQAVLALINEPISPPGDRSHPDDMQSRVGRLSYSLVLVPHFPEHKLAGATASSLPAWVEQICLAWEWHSQEVGVFPDYLLLRLELNPESAPAQAVQQIKADLASKILAQRKEWSRALPSGRFFAPKHLLSSGSGPNPQQIQQFIRHVRKTQGFSI
jgi:CheY-like chemotaxis protein